MQKELWLPVKGYGSRYLISNFGRVKSVDFYMGNLHGTKTLKKGRVLKQTLNGRGYPNVKLCFNGVGKSRVIHRLVAQAFVDNPENKPQVNHIDGNKTNNHYTNLEWCTNQENQIHAVKNGLVKPNKGEKHHRSKLKRKDVIHILNSLKMGKKMSELSRLYNVSVSAIYYIKKGKNWGHIKI